jgi:hypothetical protein
MWSEDEISMRFDLHKNIIRVTDENDIHTQRGDFERAPPGAGN